MWVLFIYACTFVHIERSASVVDAVVGVDAVAAAATAVGDGFVVVATAVMMYFCVGALYLSITFVHREECKCRRCCF